MCATGGKALFVQTDVGEESAVVSLADAVRTHYGHVDILYNNAAVLYHNLEARAHELSLAIWEHTLRVNLRGLWLCSKYMIPLMLRSGGSIIHVGSPTALNGSGAGMTAYCVSKGGILALTKAMAMDYARDNLRVNCIIPGVMDTPMNATFLADAANKNNMVLRIPLGRVGTSDDVLDSRSFWPRRSRHTAPAASTWLMAGSRRSDVIAKADRNQRFFLAIRFRFVALLIRT